MRISIAAVWLRRMLVAHAQETMRTKLNELKTVSAIDARTVHCEACQPDTLPGKGAPTRRESATTTI
jgi:hypothetical protein